MALIASSVCYSKWKGVSWNARKAMIGLRPVAGCTLIIIDLKANKPLIAKY